MNFLLFANGAAAVDPSTGAIVNLLGGLGAAGAAVTVVWFFLAYLKDDRKQRTDETIQRDKRYEEVVERLMERMDGMARRLDDNASVMRQFMQSANGICKAAEFMNPNPRRQSQ